MQQKWTYFTIGIMAGVIAVLATVLLMQPKDTLASPTALQDSAQQAGIALSTGGSQQNIQDVLWVLHKRHVANKAGGDTADITKKDERLTLCCYQVTNNAKGMRLVSVRDISFDMDLIEYKNEPPSVKDIVEALEKEQKKKSGK